MLNDHRNVSSTLPSASWSRCPARRGESVEERPSAPPGLTGPQGTGPTVAGPGRPGWGLAGLGTQITGGGRGLGKKNVKPTCSGLLTLRSDSLVRHTFGQNISSITYLLTTRYGGALRRLCWTPRVRVPRGGSKSTAAYYLRLRGCCGNATLAFVKVSLCRSVVRLNKTSLRLP